MSLLEKWLTEIGKEIKHIENEERKSGKKFNVFSILGLERKEVQGHSKYIYELINPSGSHAQGNIYLDLFLEHVLKLEDKTDIGTKLAYREAVIDEKRRIDFIITTSNQIFAIEMKIDAKDEDKQLEDYYNYIQKNYKNAKLYYLTLDGRPASEKSRGKLTDEDYERISFEKDILGWIEQCIENTPHNLSFIYESLVQYRNLILKITGQSGEEIKKKMTEIINTSDMVKTATEISKNIHYIWAKKEADFWTKVSHDIKAKYDNSWEIKYSSTNLANYQSIDYLINESIVKDIEHSRRKSSKADHGLVFLKKGTSKNPSQKLISADSVK